MFYWLDSKAKKEQLRAALDTINAIYGVHAPIWADDMLIALGKHCGFRDDPRMQKAVNEVAQRPQEHSLAWRVHTLAWAAAHCRHVPGDFVECGVFRAYSTAVVARVIEFDKVAKTWYLYDAWGDIVEKEVLDDRHRATYGDPEQKRTAAERCAPFPNIRLVQGLVPQVFATVCPERVSFLHIDMNNAVPEIAALEILFDRVSPGGVIVLDDYGWAGRYKAQKPAHDAFFAARGHEVMELPTGQGMIIRH
jgi:hypothetical protein